MLTLSRSDDRFDITHISEGTGRQMVYSFSDSFLPVNTIRHVNDLGLFLQSNVTYTLNSMDDKAVAEVLHKLIRERHSGYIFSDDLQKTFLLEFIHLMTKVHFRSTV